MLSTASNSNLGAPPPAEDNPVDAAIMSAFAEDASQGLWRLLETHGGRVRHVLSRRFADALDEHLIEVALFNGGRKALHRYLPERGSLGGWFLFLADQAAIDLLRGEAKHRKRSVPMGSRDLADPRYHAPDRRLLTSELTERVHSAIGRLLSELERTVILADLDAGGEANPAVLAKRLSTSRWSVYAARARARAKLQRALAPWMESHPAEAADKPSNARGHKPCR